MSLAILFHFLCTQHVSDINISITRSLQLCWWITTSVILFSVRCVLEIWYGWVWVVPVLQASACYTGTTETEVVLQPATRALLKLKLCFSLQHGHYSNWSCASAYNTGTTQTQPHQLSNTQQTENKATAVVIQQHSRKLLMMDILMSETCWVHKKWNKIASDIKLVFYSSTVQCLFLWNKYTQNLEYLLRRFVLYYWEITMWKLMINLPCYFYCRNLSSFLWGPFRILLFNRIQGLSL